MATITGLALDAEHHDLMITSSGNLAMTIDSLAVAQHLKQRLLLYAGEWFLDTDAGTPWLQYVFTVPFNRPIAEGVIKQAILGTPDVISLDAFDMQVDTRTRALSVLSMAITTTLGQQVGVTL